MSVGPERPRQASSAHRFTNHRAKAAGPSHRLTRQASRQALLSPPRCGGSGCSPLARGPTTSPPLFAQTTNPLSLLRGCPLVALLHWDPDVMGGGGNPLGELKVRPPAVAVASRGGAPACPAPPREPPSLCCNEGGGWCQRRPPSPNAAWQLALAPYAPFTGGGGGEVALNPVARCLGGHCCATCRCVHGPISSPCAGRPVPARRRAVINALTDPHEASRSQPRPTRLRLPDWRALGWSSGWACRQGRCRLFVVVGSVLEAPSSALAVALAWKHSPCVSSRRLRPDCSRGVRAWREIYA